VPYSPLGRGFISGEIKSPDDFPENDFRRSIPKFQGEQFYKNIELLNELNKLAAEKNITPSQLAIAWTINKGFVPIPGTKRVKYVEQNIAAADVIISDADTQRLESIIPLGTATGNRYDDWGMTMVSL
jgi:aryl-alcohol dehydrogenase-like predicted oxidoreductase